MQKSDPGLNPGHESGENLSVEEDGAGRHFSGTPTRMLVENLREHAPEGTLEAVLAEAGDTRELRELLDDGAWSSCPVFRRLLEGAARALGGPAALVEVGRHAPLIPPTSAQRTEMLQAGSSR